jgi:hypothetical protein
VPRDSSRGAPEEVMRRIVRTVSLGLALIFPAVAASQQKSNNATAPSSPPQVCTAGGNRQPTTVNAEYVWRLRAYEDLDCAFAILDEALKAPGSVIMIPREEAEQARASVWSARDAAARIGR